MSSFVAANPRISEPSYKLDPDGDILLVVTHPPSTPKCDSCTEEVDPVVVGSETTQTTSSLTSPIDQHEDAHSPVEDLSRVISRTSMDPANESSSSSSEMEQDSFASFQVSSKHLALASPVFKNMLEVGRQSQQAHSAGIIRLPMQNDDPDALLILLRLIHGRYKEVPREVDFRILTKIAILVDKYEILETTELLRDHWVSQLSRSVPTELNDDLLIWIFVAEVFQETSLFEKISRIAKIESTGPLAMRGLPIPGEILARIDICRQDTLRDIFAYLKQIQDHLLCEEICPEGIECDGMALGCLMKGLKALNILQPPEPPYEKFSIRDVFEGLKKLRIPHHCRAKRKKPIYYLDGRFCEGVQGQLTAKVEELEHQLEVHTSD